MVDNSVLVALPVAASCVLRDFQTRFLYPFHFARRCTKEALAALRLETFSARDCQPRPLWEAVEARHLYKDELLDHVVRFLFGGGETCCGYVKIADAAANSWFAQAEVTIGDQAMAVRSVPGGRIELFLSPQGVGVLSLALMPGHNSLLLEDAVEFNYRLAQFRRRPVGRLRKRHPQDDPMTWDKMSPDDRSAMLSAPPDDAPLAQRLGVPGGSFTLAELVAHLVEPLGKLGLRVDQSELSVHTIARFDAKADFGDDTAHTRLAPFLSALAQVEEPGHSGMPPGKLGVPDAILNRRHWAAVGLLGSAHLIADQGDKEFDEQKMAVVRDKYFIPFLVALLQRLALNRGIEEAGKLLSSATPKVPESLVVLRDDLLRFAIEGHFTQVSSRHALHRFYLLAREGLDVPCAWDEVRRAIADLEARFSAQRQSQIAQGIARNIRMVARVQSIAEVVEIFIVSVYAAHLWDMFAKGNEFLETHLLPDWRPWIIHGGVIAFALLGGLITLLLVRPWRHEDQSD